MAKQVGKKGGYGADYIQVFEGLEPVRKRPGMYIGSTGPDGLHHLIWEIFDNSRDEAMNGYADRVEVALQSAELLLDVGLLTLRHFSVAAFDDELH